MAFAFRLSLVLAVVPLAVALVVERPALTHQLSPKIDAAGEAPGDRAAVSVLIAGLAPHCSALHKPEQGGPRRSATIICDSGPLAPLPTLRRVDPPQANRFRADFQRVAVDHPDLTCCRRKGNRCQQTREHEPFDTLSDMHHHEPIRAEALQCA